MDDVLAGLPSSRKLGPGRYGAAGPQVGITLRAVDRAAATLVSPTAGICALGARAAEGFGAALPSGPCWIAGQEVEFIGIGPGRWLALAEGDSESLIGRLEKVFAPAAAVIDQSGGLVVFEATGQRIRHMLAKLLAIDIDPAAFPPGSAATTAVAHVGITVWLDANGTCWRFAVGLSYEAAFLRAIAEAAAEYGFELQA